MAQKIHPFQQVKQLLPRYDILTRSGRVYTLARLMSGLPQFFEPIRLAQHGAMITGELAVSQLPRLLQSLHDSSGTVRIRLQCSSGTEGAIRIHGNLTTTLKVECQRCLAAFDLPLDVDFDAQAMSESGSPADLDRDVDVLMRGEDNVVHLAGFVEDELILAVPLAPLHPPGQCPVSEYRAEPIHARAHPFATLQSLKLNKD